MQQAAAAPGVAAHIEASLLAVLLSAENARGGASSILEVLTPILDDDPSALAVRDRDGLTLHVLAEAGTPHSWPTRLAPQFAVGSIPGVDHESGVMVVPLCAHGRVVGALLLADAEHAASLVRSSDYSAVWETTAAVLHAFTSRTERALRRRATSLRSVGSILDGMAHQLANPLTGASAIAQLLVDDLEDEKQKAAVLQIRHELSRAFTVLRDMLDFQNDTRAQDGVLELNAFVERILRFRGYAIREQGIKLDVQLAREDLAVRADARAIEHALLLALRFAERHSQGTVNRCIDVRVVVTSSSDLAVEIVDSGTGDIPDITPKFFDLSWDRPDEPVRGAFEEKPDLGLVDSILRGCGGRLDVRGSKADGTTLALILPKVRAPRTSSGRIKE